MLMQAKKLMTTAELLAIPDDGVRRWLVDGELREGGTAVRNRFHSRVMSRDSQILNNWLDSRPVPRGQILCGEAGIILAHDPHTMIGVDIAYLTHETMTADARPSSTPTASSSATRTSPASPCPSPGSSSETRFIPREAGP